jgi:integrase
VAATLAEAVGLKSELKGEEPAYRPARQRFENFVTQWSEVHGSELHRSTKVRYATSLAHACAEFGNVFVDGICPADIRKWMAKMVKTCPCGTVLRVTPDIPIAKVACPSCGHIGPYARPTINGWLRILRVVFDDAVADGILDVNPARAVKTLPEGRTKGKRGTALNAKQFRSALRAIDALVEMKKRDREKKPKVRGTGISPEIARMLMVVAWTGMRRGELMALKWSDSVEGELCIERSVYRRGEKTTKTDDPRRITIVEPLAQTLEDQRRWLLQTQHPGLGSGLVFPASPQHAKAGATRRGVDELSWYRSPSVLDEPIRRVVAEAKIPPISPQSFRRTWENMLREAGVDQLVRRALAGWRTDKAQGIYATVDRSERDAASEAVVSFIFAENETISAQVTPGGNTLSHKKTPSRVTGRFQRAGDGI